MFRATSLALALVFCASTTVHALPLSKMLHLHPHARPADDRIRLLVVNTSGSFRDVKIDGKVYTIGAHDALDVKAAVGTVIYADSNVPMHRRGDVLFTVTAEMQNGHKAIL